MARVGRASTVADREKLAVLAVDTAEGFHQTRDLFGGDGLEGAALGVVITASHNPAAYNGFKYKPDYAGSASPEVVEALEACIEAGDVLAGFTARLRLDRVAPGQGFPTHGHADMEIITYILSGQLEHKDSLGNGRVIRAGDVQYMAAGTGVRHSEFNPSKDEAVHLLQIWLQPDAKGVPPRYAEKSFAKAAPGEWHLVTSKTGREGSLAIHQDADLRLLRAMGEAPPGKWIRGFREGSP